MPLCLLQGGIRVSFENIFSILLGAEHDGSFNNISWNEIKKSNRRIGEPAVTFHGFYATS
jgi:hypothetical protein